MISFAMADVSQLIEYTRLTCSVEKQQENPSFIHYESFNNAWPGNINLLRQIPKQSLSEQNSLEEKGILVILLY
jgi:hypothetical protein